MNMRIFSRVKRLATGKSMLLVASTALAVVLASCAAQKGGTGPTKPASTSPNGKIAFARLDNQVGEFDIFMVEPDGTGLRKLAAKPVQDNSLAWSPNGKRLAFEASEGLNDFNIDIYIMNACGSGVKRITKESTLDRMPSWSPDGTKIAFTRASASRADVFAMNADGTHIRKLIGKTDGFSPAFSPDGKRIVFTSNDDQTTHIYVMNADGTDVRRLTTNSKVYDDAPDWQPLPSS